MKAKSFYRFKWDAIGIGASLACAIHCVLLPIFFTTLPMLGIEIMENMVLEIITVATSLLVGSWALFNGYRKHHHHIWPLLVFITGITCMLSANMIVGTLQTEIFLKSIGVGCIITAHAFNWRYCKRCAVCERESSVVRRET